MKPISRLAANQSKSTGWPLLNLSKKLTSLFTTEKPMLIADQQDSYGNIRIFEMGDYRFLEFGHQIEQSCVFMPDPSWLEYDYTRAMLMGAMCHPNPSSALFLGLGAGTLTTACLKFLPLQHANAIELRAEVISLAKQYLALPTNAKLTIQVGDALELLAEQQSVDLIFLDLYTDHGPSEGHSAWNFLGECRKKLKPNGWLIINQWALPNGIPKDQPLLNARFHKHYWQCLVESGNIVLIVPQNKTQKVDFQQLQQCINKLEPQLGYSLQPLLDNLTFANQ